MSKIILAVVVSLVVGATAFAAPAPQTHSSIEREERRASKNDWSFSPVTGLQVVGGEAAANVGSHADYKIFSHVPFYFEPSVLLGIYSDAVQFHTDAGARYDINVPDTDVKPFVRFSLGPTFQTTGTTVVFNMFGGAGAKIPVSSSMTLRGELGLFQVDGRAGFQFLAGVAL